MVKGVSFSWWPTSPDRWVNKASEFFIKITTDVTCFRSFSWFHYLQKLHCRGTLKYTSKGGTGQIQWYTTKKKISIWYGLPPKFILLSVYLYKSTQEDRYVDRHIHRHAEDIELFHHKGEPHVDTPETRDTCSNQGTGNPHSQAHPLLASSLVHLELYARFYSEIFLLLSRIM